MDSDRKNFRRVLSGNEGGIRHDAGAEIGNYPPYSFDASPPAYRAISIIRALLRACSVGLTRSSVVPAI